MGVKVIQPSGRRLEAGERRGPPLHGGDRGLNPRGNATWGTFFFRDIPGVFECHVEECPCSPLKRVSPLNPPSLFTATETEAEELWRASRTRATFPFLSMK